VSIEAVIIIPAFLLFLVLLVGIGRVSAAQADVQAAAVEGARIASLSATAPLAERAATAAMTARLNADHPYCVDPTIVVDAADLALAPGESGQVSVHISCQVRLGDLVGVGFGGTLTLTGDFATPLDPYSLR
jgi:hypothetical protein